MNEQRFEELIKDYKIEVSTEILSFVSVEESFYNLSAKIVHPNTDGQRKGCAVYWIPFCSGRMFPQYFQFSIWMLSYFEFGAKNSEFCSLFWALQFPS